MKICIICGEIYNADFNYKCYTCGLKNLRKIITVNINNNGKFNGTYEQSD